MSIFFSQSREATFKDGCLSLRKSTLDKFTANIAPGPIYTPKARVSSNEKRLREITFGTGPARHQDHINRRALEPGPHTYDPECIQNARVSGKKNPVGVRFSTGPRTYNDIAKKKGPSPQEYDPEKIRKGIINTKSGCTSIKFGTGPARYNDLEMGTSTPGPQAYDPCAIKRGIMSTKSSMQYVKFGNPPPPPSSQREAKSTKGQAASGHFTPGPQEYDTESIRKGMMSLSKNHRPAGMKFGTGRRAACDSAAEKARSAVPGPSSYGVPSSLGPQIDSRYKSQPKVSFGAR